RGGGPPRAHPLPRYATEFAWSSGRVAVRRRGVEREATEPHEHIAEPAPLRSAHATVALATLDRGAVATATAIAGAAVDDDGDALDAAHHRREMVVGRRLAGRHDQKPPR